MSTVVVLNADMAKLHVVSLKHAIRMIMRNVAVIHEDSGEQFGAFKRPTVVRLINYVVTHWRWNKQPRWSKGAVLDRDERKCAYNLSHKATTIDHVMPRSRGGKNTFTNTVAACESCNHRKGDRTPEEAGMVLHLKPYAPDWSDPNFRPKKARL